MYSRENSKRRVLYKIEKSKASTRMVNNYHITDLVHAFPSAGIVELNLVL